MTTPPTFRRATDADAELLAQLVHSAYRGDSSRTGWSHEADLLEGRRIDADQVRAVIADPDSELVVVVDDDGAVLGCCQLEHRAGALAYFGMFAVRPGRQGSGTGKLVMAEAERRAVAAWGVRAMEMTVIGQRTELIEFYERRGYARTGETRPFPYGDARFGVPQRDDLHFVVLRKDLGRPGDVSGRPAAQAK